MFRPLEPSSCISTASCRTRERAAVQAHLSGCAECRQALEDLSVIRAALAGRPDVATPPGGDWSGFMGRLNAAVAAEQSRPVVGAGDPVDMTARSRTAGRRLAPYLALAATLALVAAGVSRRAASARRDTRDRHRCFGSRALRRSPGASGRVPASRTTEPDPALMAVSGQHFERSKLVVLG